MHAVVTVKDSGFYAFPTVLDKLLGFVARELGRIVFPENASVSVTPCLRQAGHQGQSVCLVLHPAVPFDWAVGIGLAQVRDLV